MKIAITMPFLSVAVEDNTGNTILNYSVRDYHLTADADGQ